MARRRENRSPGGAEILEHRGQGQNAKGSVWGDGETGNTVVRPVAGG